MEQSLRRDVLTAGDSETWRVFPDLDHGVEWFEEQVLNSETGQQAAVQAQPGAVQAGQEQGGLALLFAALGVEAEEDEATSQALLRLMAYLERVTLDTGQILIRQDEYQPYLYFLDAGELTVEYRTVKDQSVRLSTSGPGAIVGELSPYLDAPASATVTAAQPSTAYRLSGSSLRQLERQDPFAAAVLHRFLLKRVGQRLQTTLETVSALSD